MQRNNAYPRARMANPIHYNSRRGVPNDPNFLVHHRYGSWAHNVHRPTQPYFQNNVYHSSAPVGYNFLHHAGPVRMLPIPNQVYNPSEVHDQEFDYFVVIDFEATCDKDEMPRPQEIIEFPSVLVSSATGQVEASFQTYVRPTHHQQLTDFCKELTGIQQIQVDKGVLLSEALYMHDKFLEVKGIKNKNFAVVTWSDWDCRVILESECTFKGIAKPPYFNRWINLRVPFQQRFGGARCKLKEAVELAGLTWEGRAHCGLDDARNTARLLILLMQQGVKLSITNSLQTPYDQNQRAHEQGPVEEPSAGNHRRQYFRTTREYPTGERRPNIYCFCGVLSNKCTVRRPGRNFGRSFFGCGNWNPETRTGACNYFMWASP